MRIGIDARLYHYQPAGIGQYTRSLLRALSAIDTHNDYLVLQSRKDRANLVAAPRFARRDLWTPPHHWLEQLALPLELLPLGIDLLHSPDFVPPLNWRGRSVITVMDLAFIRFPHLLTRESRRYYGQIHRAVLRADAILAISHSTKRDLVALLGAPADKITVTHLAPDPAYRPVTDEGRLAGVRAAYGLAGCFILFVGTIEPRKNLTTLLRAFSLLLQSMRDRDDAASTAVARLEPGRAPIQLAIAGRKGWLHQQVFDLADELHLTDSVRFLGGVDQADLPALYSAARILVMPSLYEGFGLPVLEAMACGTPAVCSDTSSLPEVAGDAALLVSPEDAPGMADAMMRLLTDAGLRGDLIQRGLHRASQFSWTATAEQTLAVYQAAGSTRSPLAGRRWPGGN